MVTGGREESGEGNSGETALLLFTFAAPLASFGDIAPGERRVSASRPGRSGLIGLIAAALGLKRDDPRQRPLAQCLAFAVRVDRSGGVMMDYHTTLTAPARKGRRFATRRDELQSHDLGTILSQREYRTDSAFTIAVVAQESSPFTLDQIAAVLSKPRFILTAGRRACPLGLPPAARVIHANTLAEAFAAYDAAEIGSGEGARSDVRISMGMLPRDGVTSCDIAFEPVFAKQGLVASNSVRIEARRDDPTDRIRWQFAPRPEHVIRVAVQVIGPAEAMP
jgi:CRISPR system Cascade subunit CasD